MSEICEECEFRNFCTRPDGSCVENVRRWCGGESNG